MNTQRCTQHTTGSRTGALRFGKGAGRYRCKPQPFPQQGQTAASTPLTLFQQAFAGDPIAAAALHEHFAALVKRWVARYCHLDSEDITQQAWLQFWRYAPNTPNLLHASEVGPILLYLRQCVKTACWMALRRQKSEVALEAVAELPTPCQLEQQTVHRLTLQACLDRLLHTEEERIIFRWRFEWGATPQEIVAHHRERFPCIYQVYQIIQRLTRRLRSDETLREMVGRTETAQLSASAQPA